MLKNPLEHLSPELMAMAPATAAVPQTTTPSTFKVEYGHCPDHGPFVIREQINGVIFAHEQVCQHCRREAQAASLVSRARIPLRFARATLDNFEAPTEKHARILAACRDYADNFRRYRAQGRGLILCGEPGTGKNHLATGICKELHRQRFTMVMVKAAELLDTFWGKSHAERDGWLAELCRVDLLLIDELGRQSTTDNAQNVLFRVIDGRYEAMLPIMVTTNLDRAGLIGLLGEAAYDRMAQGGTKRYTLDWESYRATAPVEESEE